MNTDKKLRTAALPLSVSIRVHPWLYPLLPLGMFLLSSSPLRAQSNYEIQVYASDLVPPGVTMTELHSNFTVDGFKTKMDGVLPDNHAEHETLEITHGWDEWFETGFYIFTSIQNGTWYYVGSHIRPRIAVPEKYHLPVGVSLSTEFGWVRPNLSTDTWTWEIRPIVDKKIEKWYLAFNPAIEKSFRGLGQPRGYEFSPDFKFSYDVTKKIAAGAEYYGGWGPIPGLEALREQQQQIFPDVDIDFGKNWEFNFGVGLGVTQSTERLIVKAILGYRFNYKGP